MKSIRFQADAKYFVILVLVFDQTFLEAALILTIVIASGTHDFIAEMPRNKSADLVLIVSRLHDFVIDDDRPFEDRWVVDDKIRQLAKTHLVDIKVSFLEDFRSGGDDVLEAVLRLF